MDISEPTGASQATDPTPPIVCTLPAEELEAQCLEWTDLAPLARSCEAIEGGVVSTYPVALADRIEQLANREAACCGTWIDIDHERTPSEFRLRMTTQNPDGVDVIRALAGLSLQRDGG